VLSEGDQQGENDGAKIRCIRPAARKKPRAARRNSAAAPSHPGAWQGQLPAGAAQAALIFGRFGGTSPPIMAASPNHTHTGAAAEQSSSAAAAPALRAEDLKVSYQIGQNRIDVLRGVTFSVDAGQRVFLCGPSGAGKTTLLYVLGGLETPAAGRVLVGNTSLYGASASYRAGLRNRLMGYVFQNYLLLPELTAVENVALPALIGGENARDRAADLLNQVGLGHRLHHQPAELSGGEQQRVAIARSLVNDPQIIFADEPTGNLDTKTGSEVMNLLLSVVAKSRKTLMVVTHDTRLAALGDRTLTLRDGMLESQA
jgi:putative ABC transport system ATP-binding protein/lipoprotein-releasing system ATP-binding protein